MKIFEYQAKYLFSNAGISIPRGKLIHKGEDVAGILEDLPFSKYILKAQTYTSGRGKAGLIIKTDNKKDTIEAAAALFEKTGRLLIEEQIDIQHELYISLTIDRSRSVPKLIFSSAGGMDIEVLSKKYPYKIFYKDINVFTGLLPYQLREVLDILEFDKKIKNILFNTIFSLYKIFSGSEATLCEINPLAVTSGGAVVAVDAKIIYDDDALFRHRELLDLRVPEEEEVLEREAKEKRLSYVKLSGNIGCIVNGAGLAMATMDVIKHFGAEPANFLDIGGAAKAQQVEDSLSILNADESVKSIFINIFGGIVRCDEVARGIIKAKNELNISKPIIIRLIGTNDKEAYEILMKEDISSYKNMSEAAQAVVSLL